MTGTAGTGTRIVCSLGSADGAGLVHVEDHFATDIDDLWSAITRPDRLARWIGQVHGDLHVGGVFHARFTSTWEGDGRVDVCEPPNRLLLTMSPGQEDQRVIEAWLSPVDDGTLLVVEERGLPVGELPSYGAGWQAHLEDLAAHLAGAERADWRSRWSELAPLYRDMVEGPRERAERASLMTFLDAQRRSVLAILDGLEDNDLVMPEIATTRDIVLHMIEETARHAGHLDLARELIDGRTGLGPR